MADSSNGIEWADTLVGFDTETTGTDPHTDRIVTATVVVVGEDGVQSERSWLINPGVPISDEAAAVHGVSNEYAREHGANPAAAIAEIVGTLNRATADKPAVAYNAAFDFTLLRAEAARYGVPFKLPELIVDPLVIDRTVWKFRKGKRTLQATYEAYFGRQFDGAHDATADAVAACQLAHELVRRNPRVLLPEHLMTMQAAWKSAQAGSLESYLRRVKDDPTITISREWPIMSTPPSSSETHLPSTAARRPADGTIRRGDRGLGKTASGGNKGSFASHERQAAAPPTPTDNTNF